MRPVGPFNADELRELDERLLSQADRVVPMRDIFKGDTGTRVIGVRHDVDDNPGAFEAALAMAEWEFERGYSSTYYLLHTAPYWSEEMLCEVERFEELGHEVGIHANALVAALRTGGDPARILAQALHELRSAGVRVVGSSAHGDPGCRDEGKRVVFANDELFLECARTAHGAPDRTVSLGDRSLKIEPLPLAVFGLEYDAAWLSRGDYLSDSGYTWSQPFERVVSGFGERGQLHVLIHPDWWCDAFAPQEVAA